VFQKLILGTKTTPEFKVNYSLISGTDAINFTKIITGAKLLEQNVILE